MHNNDQFVDDAEQTNFKHETITRALIKDITSQSGIGTPELHLYCEVWRIGLIGKAPEILAHDVGKTGRFSLIFWE